MLSLILRETLKFKKSFATYPRSIRPSRLTEAGRGPGRRLTRAPCRERWLRAALGVRSRGRAARTPGRPRGSAPRRNSVLYASPAPRTGTQVRVQLRGGLGWGKVLKIGQEREVSRLCLQRAGKTSRESGLRLP